MSSGLLEKRIKDLEIKVAELSRDYWQEFIKRQDDVEQLRIDTIEKCVLWLEVLHPHMPIETVMERLRSLKDIKS